MFLGHFLLCPVAKFCLRPVATAATTAAAAAAACSDGNLGPGLSGAPEPPGAAGWPVRALTHVQLCIAH